MKKAGQGRWGRLEPARLVAERDKPRRYAGARTRAGLSLPHQCELKADRWFHGGSMVPHENVTTAFDLPGFRVKRNLGVVRGIVVRSRSIVGTIGAGLQTIVGGNISLFSNLCERTRGDAFELMLDHAGQLGANAVIGARYDATEIMNGVTEVLAYGTAVIVEPAE